MSVRCHFGNGPTGPFLERPGLLDTASPMAPRLGPHRGGAFSSARGTFCATERGNSPRPSPLSLGEWTPWERPFPESPFNSARLDSPSEAGFSFAAADGCTPRRRRGQALGDQICDNLIGNRGQPLSALPWSPSKWGQSLRGNNRRRSAVVTCGQI